MKEILFWIDYNVISHVARWCGKGNDFVDYMYRMYPDHFSNEIREKELRNGTKPDDVEIVCPNCLEKNWYVYDTIDDLSMNIQCSNCKKKYNYVFGSKTVGPYVKVN